MNVQKFIEGYLAPYGISREDVEIDIDGDEYFYVNLPNGLRIGNINDDWFYNSYEDINMDYILLDDDELDKILKGCARDCKRKKKYKELKAENARLSAEIELLRATIEELQLRPGGSEFENAKKHFEKIVGDLNN